MSRGASMLRRPLTLAPRKRGEGTLSLSPQARRGNSPLYDCFFGLFKMNEWAVELVGKGVRGGKRAAFSTASAPVRRRRIVHKSTARFWFRRGSSYLPGDIKPVGEQGASRRLSLTTRTVARANKPAFLQGWV